MSTTAGHRNAASLAVLAIGLMACGRGSAPPAAAKTASVLRSVHTAVVERSGGAGSVAVPATVEARQRAALATRLSASLIELPRREGDRVAAGAVVARLDDSALRSSLGAAEAAARAAEVDLARVERLLKKGAATPKELDDSRARASAAAAAVAGARDHLAYAVLRAPFAGTVASRSAHVGDVVSPGTILIVIEGESGLEVRATVEADLASPLRPGLTFDALVDGQRAPLTATVRAVSAAADPATHRFEVRADLPAAEGLRSGLFARLLVPSARATPRLRVPEGAVFQRGGLDGVFVVANGEARLRWVAVGATAGGLTEIRAGLEASEHVALETAGLADGQAVTDARAGAR
jgi:membrane fusion protein, multidrug efflux system